MWSATDPSMALLFHGWVELLTLLLLQFVALFLWGWANNRGLRPSDRRQVPAWPVLLTSYALVLVLRAVDGEWPVVAAIAGAVLIAGLIGSSGSDRALWLPAMLLAALIGLGFLLSALILIVVGFLFLLFTRKRS